jgi:hypothetical protein
MRGPVVSVVRAACEAVVVGSRGPLSARALRGAAMTLEAATMPAAKMVLERILFLVLKSMKS